MDYVRLITCSTRFVWRMNTQHHSLVINGRPVVFVEQVINRTKTVNGLCSINYLFDSFRLENEYIHWLLMDVLSCSSNKGLIEHSPEKDFVRLIHCSTRLNSFTNKLELELYIN
jgi:hypothetical protein